jgi:hypothetical protein
MIKKGANVMETVGFGRLACGGRLVFLPFSSDPTRFLRMTTGANVAEFVGFCRVIRAGSDGGKQFWPPINAGQRR